MFDCILMDAGGSVETSEGPAVEEAGLEGQLVDSKFARTTAEMAKSV